MHWMLWKPLKSEHLSEHLSVPVHVRVEGGGGRKKEERDRRGNYIFSFVFLWSFGVYLRVSEFVGVSQSLSPSFGVGGRMLTSVVY